MRLLSLFAFVLLPTLAFAQAPAAAPKANPAACDVTYTMESETADGRDVMNSKLAVYALPYAEVQDNSRKGLRVIDVASRQQDKGGTYSIELGEYRVCDGGPVEKVAANSILVKGVTLRGANRISRTMLQVSADIVDRYEGKDDRGAKAAWDHDKARKVKRNDLHQKQW